MVELLIVNELEFDIISFFNVTKSFGIQSACILDSRVDLLTDPGKNIKNIGVSSNLIGSLDLGPLFTRGVPK